MHKVPRKVNNESLPTSTCFSQREGVNSCIRCFTHCIQAWCLADRAFSLNVVDTIAREKHQVTAACAFRKLLRSHSGLLKNGVAMPGVLVRPSISVLFILNKHLRICSAASDCLLEQSNLVMIKLFQVPLFK